MAEVQAPKFEQDERGDIRLYVVWALRPGQPQIVAICSSRKVAGRYKPFVTEHHVGARFFVEPVIVDHLFGAGDIQSVAFRASVAWSAERQN